MSKRLCRSRSNKKIFGVCGGISEFIGLDATLIRLAVAITSIVTAQFVLAFLLYLLFAFILPSNKEKN